MSLSSSTTSTRLMPAVRDSDPGGGTVELIRGHSTGEPRQLDRDLRLISSIPGGTRVDAVKPTAGIMALHTIRRKGAAAARIGGLGTFAVAGCSRDASLSGAQLAASAAGAPMSVACEPQQRAVV